MDLKRLLDQESEEYEQLLEIAEEGEEATVKVTIEAERVVRINFMDHNEPVYMLDIDTVTGHIVVTEIIANVSKLKLYDMYLYLEWASVVALEVHDCVESILDAFPETHCDRM